MDSTEIEPYAPPDSFLCRHRRVALAVQCSHWDEELLGRPRFRDLAQKSAVEKKSSDQPSWDS
jgi:hypothetical protein